jgi:hypothetical protein
VAMACRTGGDAARGGQHSGSCGLIRKVAFPHELSSMRRSRARWSFSSWAI